MRWSFDYVRKPKGILSFLQFIHGLGRIRKHGGGAVLVDGLERLFRKLPGAARAEMADALVPYESVIIDVQRMRSIKRLKSWQWHAIVLSGLTPDRPKPPRPVAPDDERDTRDTSEARRVSARSRAQLADRAAKTVRDLRDELVRAGKAPSNLALARESNARGLRTSRGNEWSDVTVARALKRLADREAEN